ncbi:N-formylglutamate deformylase [Brevundimonas sp. VNH65]|uniref:N-formylglutamate deformylase n=1 Tax=Brevundimonas sp. VNH65 TaxID=3400917 RepID=UPI003C102D3E
MATHDWLTVQRGEAPLVIGLPHTGTDIPDDILAGMISPWLARKDADWWVDRLYAFAADMGATLVRTSISRSVIDVNRDPSGASLYPGMTTTGLCPTETFDGEPLYRPGLEPDQAEIDRRRVLFFDPYHAALTQELERLGADGPVVLYDAHSIRSVVPRLFEGELPQFNIGDNGGTTCAPALTRAVEAACAVSDLGHVVNGRFKGGWTTRHYGRPDAEVHAIQMELADRGYMDDPAGPLDTTNWPAPWRPEQAARLQPTLSAVLTACLDFAHAQRASR